MENMQEQWLLDVNNKPKLRTYITFKHTVNTEDYVSSYISRNQRSLLAQIRLGILPLHVETGRFKNIKDNVTGNYRKLKLEERLCNLCNLNAVEDEFHFVCVCTKYEKERNVLFNQINSENQEFINLSLRDKFIYIMQTEWKHLSKYLEAVWAIRQNALYV